MFRMTGTIGEKVTFISEVKKVEKSRWPVQAQECSMCGDVGFSDQLHQCTRCCTRYQHTYCSNSTEGLMTGTWMCDWCRLVKEEPQAATEPPSAHLPYAVLSEDSAGLECLLKAALSEVQYATRVDTPSADAGSLCSSSVESAKDNDKSFDVPESPSCSNNEMLSHHREEDSAFLVALPRGSRCDPRRNPKLAGSGTKVSQRKRQRALIEQQCGSSQLKRLLSMKNSETGIPCDPPKGFVRRYKSLSDISF